MASLEHLDVDPRTLRLPPSRLSGADPYKLQRQIIRFGASMVGMPRVLVSRALDGELVICDGVTRAIRIAKLLPGQSVPVEVGDMLRVAGAKLPTIGDLLP